MTNQRIARILNGALVLTFSVLTTIDARFVGLLMFMGASLIFSGVMDFCGFAVILQRIRKPKP